MVDEEWFGNGSGDYIQVLRAVKFEEINRLYWRKQEKKNYSQSRARVWFKAVGLGFLNLYLFLWKSFENLMKATDLFLGNCI